MYHSSSTENIFRNIPTFFESESRMTINLYSYQKGCRLSTVNLPSLRRNGGIEPRSTLALAGLLSWSVYTECWVGWNKTWFIWAHKPCHKCEVTIFWKNKCPQTCCPFENRIFEESEKDSFPTNFKLAIYYISTCNWLNKHKI